MEQYSKSAITYRHIFLCGIRKTFCIKQKVASDLLVTGDRLMLVSFENLVAVIITDHAIADMQRRFLKFIWKKV